MYTGAEIEAKIKENQKWRTVKMLEKFLNRVYNLFHRPANWEITVSVDASVVRTRKEAEDLLDTFIAIASEEHPNYGFSTGWIELFEFVDAKNFTFRKVPFGVGRNKNRKG
jgi:hypothetical protein